MADGRGMWQRPTQPHNSPSQHMPCVKSQQKHLTPMAQSRHPAHQAPSQHSMQSDALGCTENGTRPGRTLNTHTRLKPLCQCLATCSHSLGSAVLLLESKLPNHSTRGLVGQRTATALAICKGTWACSPDQAQHDRVQDVQPHVDSCSCRRRVCWHELGLGFPSTAHLQ